MKIVSQLKDQKINATNILIEITISEYEKLVNEVISNNEFQRKRVNSSKTIYALLKGDLLQECVIPPLVLALTEEINFNGSDENLYESLKENKNHLVILDGLQRTYTIFDLLKELRDDNSLDKLEKLLNTTIRVEIYIGLNRLGILYRMLTLNTGQTPMSLRQQIDMLYSDYLNEKIDNIELIRESDVRNVVKKNEYSFKEIVEGFNAYLERDELPIDRADILENINSLEKLAKENQDNELFEAYLKVVNKVVHQMDLIFDGSELSDEFRKDNPNPFGSNAVKIFKRPQSISGLGAAIGKLIDFEAIAEIDDIAKLIDQVDVDDAEVFLENFNIKQQELKANSKKIGNTQRTFFTFFYRELFNKEAIGYLSLEQSLTEAYRKYISQH